MRKLALMIMFAWMGVAQAKTWLIDVRTPEEFAQGHLSAAANIEYQDIAAGIARLGAAKQDDIQLYCHSGRRAGLAQETLKRLGYSHVENLGGIEQARKHPSAAH